MTRNERRDEVREILALDTDELVKRSNGQLVLFPTLDEVYDYLAEEMVNEFEKAAKGDKIVSFIVEQSFTSKEDSEEEKAHSLRHSAVFNGPKEVYRQSVTDSGGCHIED